MIQFARAAAEVFVPDGAEPEGALARTTHLGVGAHHDDLEIMAAHGILECFERDDRWFTGVVVSDGAGSPRAGEYAGYDDARMQGVRAREQKRAATVGGYAAQILLSHPSAAVKDPAHGAVAGDLAAALRLTRPSVVYTHNLADRHETHVAVALRLVEALRRLPAAERPERVIGCEVWRDLDWLCDEDRVAMVLDGREHLQAALLGVFDSQIAGGKRYDTATLGRRRAHATYSESHGADRNTHVVWGMDLTPLIHGERDPEALLRDYLRRFQEDALTRLAKLR